MKPFIFCLLFSLFPISLFGGNNQTGLFDFPLTRLLLDPRGSALGGSPVSGPGLDGFILNPGSLSAENGHPQYSFVYIKWIEDIHVVSGRMGLPFGKKDNSFGMALDYISLGKIIVTDSLGEPTGSEIGNHSLRFRGNYSINAGSWGVGFGFDLGMYQFNQNTSQYLAFRTGFNRELTQRLYIACVLHNIDLFSHLPFTADLGAGIRLGVINREGRFYTDFHFAEGVSSGLKSGFEYVYQQFVSIRIGYQIFFVPSSDYNKGLSFGVGLNNEKWVFDLAYIPVSGLQNSLQVSLTYKMGYKLEEETGGGAGAGSGGRSRPGAGLE